MQQSAPEALDLPARRPATQRLYGLGRPGKRRLRPPVPAGTPAARARCPLRAGLERRRRPEEQLGQPHRHSQRAARDRPHVDRPIAGLLRDLKARGLLDDTLVVFSTEFGRQPFTQGATGRDHNGGTSVAWLAGCRRQGRHIIRRKRPLGLAGRHRADVLLRPSRYDPALAGNRPHAA